MVPGVYEFSDPLPLSFTKASGGTVEIGPHGGGDVRLKMTDGPFFPFVEWNAYEILVERIRFFGNSSYYSAQQTALDPVTWGEGIIRIGMDAASLIHPTRLELGDVELHNTQRLALLVSEEAETRTEVGVYGLRSFESANNGHLSIRGRNSAIAPLGFGGNATIKVIDHVGTGINGPDGANRGGVFRSSHQDGPASLLCQGFAHGSTIEVVRPRYTATLWGSANHDGHTLIFHFLNSADVQVDVIDGQFELYWMDGWATGDGGGNLWQCYYHDGGLNYSTEGSRPTLHFKNCRWFSYIDAAVDETPSATFTPTRSIIQCMSSSDYYFTDCRVEWDIQSPPLDDGDVWGVRLAADSDSSAWIQNTTQVNCPKNPSANGSRPAGNPDGDNRVWYDEPLTSLDWEEPEWQRWGDPWVVRKDPCPLIDPYCEEGLIVLSGAATRVTTGGVEGPALIQLYATRTVIFGTPFTRDSTAEWSVGEGKPGPVEVWAYLRNGAGNADCNFQLIHYHPTTGTTIANTLDSNEHPFDHYPDQGWWKFLAGTVTLIGDGRDKIRLKTPVPSTNDRTIIVQLDKLSLVPV